MFARFHASGMAPFFFWLFLFDTDFLLDFYLNMPLLPFTSMFAPFSWYASGGHSRSGRKGNSGNWTGKQGQASCFGKKSPALRVVFFIENLAFPNPYLLGHPKRKRPMRQKDALKKCRINERYIRIETQLPQLFESALKTKNQNNSDMTAKRRYKTAAQQCRCRIPRPLPRYKNFERVGDADTDTANIYNP